MPWRQATEHPRASTLREIRNGEPTITTGLIASAFLLGLRHGVDWDHLAAIGDIAATQKSSRRGMAMSSVYVAGHALVVLGIGSIAIVSGRNLPGWADAAMGVVVGWTLILLAIYVGYTLVRHRGQVPLRSRWMLVLGAVRRAYIWARSRLASVEARPIEHDHPHSALVSFHHDGSEAAPEGRLPRHGHRHVHDPAAEPFTDYTPATSLAIGMLHGIGAETPTQVLVFLAAANAGGTGAGLAVLTAFLVGLMLANSAITLGAVYGFVAAGRRRWAYSGLAILTAVVSLVVGVALVTGSDGVLPALLAG